MMPPEAADFGRRNRGRGRIENAGFYTIDIEHPVDLKKGERYAVIVSIRTPGSVHPVAIEYNGPDLPTQVDLSDGEGYTASRNCLGSGGNRAELQCVPESLHQDCQGTVNGSDTKEKQ